MEFEQARKKASIPGLLLMLSGIMTLLSNGVYLLFGMLTGGLSAFAALGTGDSDIIVATLTQTLGPLLFALFGMLGGLFITMAGSKLRNLSSRGMCMAGSVFAMIPCCSSFCCLFTFPFGAWALVTLMNDEVKEAMAEVAY